MRETFLLLLSIVWLQGPTGLPAQDRNLAASDLPEFLARHEDSLRPLDAMYTELANEHLPLRDEAGQLLARRHIEDRRRALETLRQTIHQLAANPGDLVLTTQLFLQTETLVDDLFDLSQVAYDNDREDLGRRLSDLMRVLDHHTGLIESYTLGLAAEKQDRIRELEKENQWLRQKLQEAAEETKAKPSPRL